MAASRDTHLARFLEGEFWELKRGFRSHIEGNPLFNLRFDLPLDEYRSITRERCAALFKSQEVRKQFDDQAKNTKDFIRKSLALGEVISTTDLSVGVKMGVMGWLYGGAVTSLGSEEHIEKFFRPMKELKYTGMFCMSERGHGSNVRGIQTEAHYDHASQEYIIHSPDDDAAKMYIGNALYGDYAAVFAQLIIDGKSKGPHCFIARIRDENGLRPGIRVVDMGMKEGLHGVDNGMLMFDHMRIPRENLLNRYADVSADGKYSTTIPKDGARFNTVIGALLGTRLALCFQALASMKLGLEIAIKYGCRRRQFGPPGKEEQLLMDYQTHQLRLMPFLAMSIGLTFATRHAGRILGEDVYLRKDVVDNRPLQALAAGLKAYTTWAAVDALQVCRECTGGMGYMEVNRLGNLKRDSDVFVTFEGDNVVMMQQVAKELLLQYGKQYGGSAIKAALAGFKSTLVSRMKTSTFAVASGPPYEPEFVLKALQFKEGELLRFLAARLLNKISYLHEAPFKAWNDCLDHVMALAWCHIRRVTLKLYMEALEKCPSKEDKQILDKFCSLHAVHLLYEDRAWFLEQNYISAAMSKQLRDKLIELCADTRHHALTIVEAFCHPAECVTAPIAGVENEDATWAYYPAPRADHLSKL